jgi:hypothetical protein
LDVLQNGELLGMAAKGTPGGEPRLDGSDSEAGIHLRWQMAPELGFPPKGFDLYRRVENYRRFLRCGALREADVVGVRWVPYNQEHADAGFTITFSGEVDFVIACGAAGGRVAYFPGEQEVRLVFEQPVRYVRITFDASTPPNPVAEAYWQASSGNVLVERERARLENGMRRINLFADRIDALVITGEDMVICEVCIVLVKDGYDQGWMQTPLNGSNPIFLPVTHPDYLSPPWPDDQVEAEERLPDVLPVEKHTAYALGFQDELHAILYDLVGTAAQHLYRLKEGDLDSAATLDWPGLSLLQLMAVDPNIARMLGLYWHDVPPFDTRFYDYRLIAHYSDHPFPGRQANYAALAPGTRVGSLLEHEGLIYFSANPMDVVTTTWDGSEHTALLFTREILAAPIAITLPEAVKSVTVRCIAAAPLAIKYYLGYKDLHLDARAAGEITSTFEERDGINKLLLLTAGELTLVEIILREKLGGMGDLIYDVYHVRASSAAPVPVPHLEPPVVISSATGLDETGALQENQNRVGLRWEVLEAGGDFLRAGAPVQFQVQREDLDEDGETVLRSAILNENAPTLLSEVTRAGEPVYSDRRVPDGTYTYAVRGADIFGVLGEWSATQPVQVQDHRPPPPPQAVQAQYLDPADPWLSPEDQAWAVANGQGLKLSWTWPGIFRLQAPDVIPPDAEFRVYGTLGAFNRLDGVVSQVLTRAGAAALYTDIHWTGAADALAGEAIRVNQNFFQVTGNTQGTNCVINVQVLSEPELAPAPGPCSLSFSRGRSYWQDYGTVRSWQRRLHFEPVQDTPVVTAEVAAVSDSTSTDTGVVVRSVTLDQPLDDTRGVLLPGALLCGGIVYPVFAHTLGETLKVLVALVPSPGNSTVLVGPGPGAACIYYPGRRYEVYLPGFELEIPAGQATAQAQIAMSTSDGNAYTLHEPLPPRTRRRDGEARVGNESALSPPVTVQVVLRTNPPGLSSVPPVPEEPIYARPANYYGQARYTLAWDAVPGVAGYAVYRCSGAALLSLAGSLDAQYSDAELQEMASLESSQPAFRRLNTATVTGTSYEDTFDGRGQGVYLYRVRTVDAAGNQSEWSPAFPPVHIYDVTPPATPVVTSITGGEKHVVLRWRANREKDLGEYWIWRDLTPEALADVRRIPPTAVVLPDGGVTVTYVDEGLEGLTTYYYRLAAVDANGNVSLPTRTLQGRAIDTEVPAPPTWEAPQIGPEPDSILLSWVHADNTLTCLIQRRDVDAEEWANLTGWLPRGEYGYNDAQREISAVYEYRLLVIDKNGRTNDRFNLIQA